MRRVSSSLVVKNSTSAPGLFLLLLIYFRRPKINSFISSYNICSFTYSAANTGSYKHLSTAFRLVIKRCVIPLILSLVYKNKNERSYKINNSWQICYFVIIFSKSYSRFLSFFPICFNNEDGGDDDDCRYSSNVP
jgi:hypothetical protein